jgi:DNA-binding transcriptional ArsR family regulator
VPCPGGCVVPERRRVVYTRPVATRSEPPISADPDRAGHVAEVLKAVAHPLRLRIVAVLCEGEENVTALAEKLGAEQAIVSQQLRILRSHGLVAASREGGFATYRLVEQNLRGLVRCMEKCGR